MDSDSIEREAAQWFAKRESGSWTPADEAQFEAWLGQGTGHRIMYIRLDAGWQRAARLKALGAGVAPGTIPPRDFWGDTRAFKRTPAADGSRRTPRKRLVACAAAVLLAVIVGGATYLMQTGGFAGGRYSTKVGALETILLADGSHVILNTNSRVRVGLADTQRSIELDHGEAFFEVAKDPKRPFVVTAGSRRIVAVGTKFSVRLENDDVIVTVAEGKVRLENASVPHAGGSAEVFVAAGSFARTAKADVLVHDNAAAQVEQLLSWRNGYLVFRDATLEEAVSEFNRYNTRQMIIKDPQIARLRIGGNFRSNNTDAFLWLLQNGFPVAVEQDGDRVILQAR